MSVLMKEADRPWCALMIRVLLYIEVCWKLSCEIPDIIVPVK